MSGIILLEREILTPNCLGTISVGPDKNNLRNVDHIGKYPAKRGHERKGIAVELQEIENSMTLKIILPYLFSLWVEVNDYQTNDTYTESLFGKESGLNVGNYQIESLGGRLTYLDKRVRIYSLESLQENSRDQGRG